MKQKYQHLIISREDYLNLSNAEKKSYQKEVKSALEELVKKRAYFTTHVSDDDKDYKPFDVWRVDAGGYLYTIADYDLYAKYAIITNIR